MSVGMSEETEGGGGGGDAYVSKTPAKETSLDESTECKLRTGFSLESTSFINYEE